jgi:hypothetical protein
VGEEIGDGPSDDGEREQAPDLAAEATAGDDQRQTEGAEGGQRAGGRPGCDPGHGITGEAAVGEEAGEGADGRSGRRGEAELTVGLRPEGDGPVDRRQEHVAHVGRLDDERPAPPAGPATDGEGCADDDPDDGRAVGRDPSDGGRVDALVTDDAREQPHHDDGHHPADVGPVEGFEHVEVGGPPAPARMPELGEGAGLVRGGGAGFPLVGVDGVRAGVPGRLSRRRRLGVGWTRRR